MRSCFYCGTKLEDVILQRLEPEKLDYVRADWVNFRRCFSYLYAAEIDRGNQAVIGAIKELVYSENNTAYLTRKMILGILRSDNREMHRMGDLLLAARLQEGCARRSARPWTRARWAFLTAASGDRGNDLIRFASVKRAVSTWIGIFDEQRGPGERQAAGAHGALPGTRSFSAGTAENQRFHRHQRGASGSKGFRDIDTAIGSMQELIDHGTKNQRLTASFYTHLLYDDRFKSRIAKDVILGYDGGSGAGCLLYGRVDLHPFRGYRQVV